MPPVATAKHSPGCKGRVAGWPIHPSPAKFKMAGRASLAPKVSTARTARPSTCDRSKEGTGAGARMDSARMRPVAPGKERLSQHSGLAGLGVFSSARRADSARSKALAFSRGVTVSMGQTRRCTRMDFGAGGYLQTRPNSFSRGRPVLFRSGPGQPACPRGFSWTDSKLVCNSRL